MVVRKRSDKVQALCLFLLIFIMEEQEKKVLSLLIQAHNEYIKLPVYHASDPVEWQHSFHALENIIMSRLAVRENPEIFVNLKA